MNEGLEKIKAASDVYEEIQDKIYDFTDGAKDTIDYRTEVEDNCYAIVSAAIQLLSRVIQKSNQLLNTQANSEATPARQIGQELHQIQLQQANIANAVAGNNEPVIIEASGL